MFKCESTPRSAQRPKLCESGIEARVIPGLMHVGDRSNFHESVMA